MCAIFLREAETFHIVDLKDKKFIKQKYRFFIHFESSTFLKSLILLLLKYNVYTIWFMYDLFYPLEA
jgi:hypothetical protein